MEGWIKLYRKIEENELYFSERFTKMQAWIDLLILANHADSYFEIRGNGIRVKEGQLARAKQTLADRWMWSRNKVIKFLNWLEKQQQIEQQKNRLITVITIKNWKRYQKNEQQNEQQKVNRMNNRMNNRKYTYKNEENEENEKNEKITSATRSARVAGRIDDLISEFEPVNPSFELLYANKSQRSSLERMVQRFTFDKVLEMIRALPDVISRPYAPKITTPYELERDLGKLIVFNKQKKFNIIKT